MSRDRWQNGSATFCRGARTLEHTGPPQTRRPVLSCPKGPNHLTPGAIGGDTRGVRGLWERFVAFLIDSILLGIIGAILTALVDETTSSTIATLLGWLYYAGMESSSRQATLGKSLMGIYVAGLDGQRISFLRATGRYFAKILSALILMIGFLMAAFTARKQALHDKIASTLVLTR